LLDILEEVLTRNIKNYRRRRIVSDLKREIADRACINFHRRNPRNVGDMSCTPPLYVPELARTPSLDIFRCQAAIDLRKKAVIIGGGGLLGHSAFVRHLSNVSDSGADHLVFWGGGQNVHGTRTVAYPEILSKFTLVGIRDHGSPFPWVPCISCLHEEFDQPKQVTNEIVVYSHREFVLSGINHLPALTNSESDIRKVIRFLASGETIVTTSYHGAYWGTLLGRRVVVVDPFSSKFFAFRHPPVLCSADDWRAGVQRAASYPHSLAECRAANVEFAERVITRIGSYL
jgi:hypothetical protein